MTITQTCAWPGCGRTFEAERVDARYCSPTCRARASKERKRAEGEEGGDEAATHAIDRNNDHRAEPGLGPGPASETGFRPDLVERFFDLEDRVDDLEFHDKEDQQKLAGLLALPARIDAVDRRVPPEAKIKEWSKEEALDVIHDLRERVEELETLVKGPDGLVNLDAAHAGLERRVAALEDPDGGDASLRIQVRRLERALAREKERNDLQSENISLLLTSVDGLAKLVEG